MTHRTIPLQLTLHPQWSPVVLDQERYGCMPGSHSIIIVGGEMFDMLGSNFYRPVFWIARARRAGQLAGDENLGNLSSTG